MYIEKHIQINALLLLIVFSCIPFSGKPVGNEENAIRLFNSKQFEEALPLFSELIKSNSSDTLLCYYTGVCLTETNHFGDKAKNLLMVAAQGSVPADVNYFIGKNFHATNFFEPALNYYNQYKEVAKKSDVKAFGLKEKISMCSNRINPFTNTHLDEGGVEESLAAPENSQETVKDSSEILTDSTSAEAKILEIPATLNDTIINFNLTSEIYYTKFFQFRTNEGKEFFVKGWKNADTLKKLISETNNLRNEYAKSYYSEFKDSISTLVLELESKTIGAKSASDFNYMKANECELRYWKHASENEIYKLIAENDSIKLLEIKKNFIEPVAIITTDSIRSDSLMSDSLKIQTTIPVPEPPKTATIFFKVQIGAYNTELPESARKLYKKISIFRKIDQFTDERNYTIYTIGELTNIKDAVKLQEQIRQESVKDAFVIAIKDGKRIPLNEALESTK